MNFINEHVSTTYQDYTGMLSLDGREEGLFGLCEENSIDTDKHFPIGFKLHGSGILGINTSSIGIIIYTLDRPNPETSYDDLMRTIRQNDGIAELRTHSLYLEPAKIAPFIKRFEILAISTEMHSVIKKLEIND